MLVRRTSIFSHQGIQHSLFIRDFTIAWVWKCIYWACIHLLLNMNSKWEWAFGWIPEVHARYWWTHAQTTHLPLLIAVAPLVTQRYSNSSSCLDGKVDRIQEHAVLPSIYQNPTADQKKLGLVKTSTYYWMLATAGIIQEHYHAKNSVTEGL